MGEKDINITSLSLEQFSEIFRSTYLFLNSNKEIQIYLKKKKHSRQPALGDKKKEELYQGSSVLPIDPVLPSCRLVQEVAATLVELDIEGTGLPPFTSVLDYAFPTTETLAGTYSSNLRT